MPPLSTSSPSFDSCCISRSYNSCPIYKVNASAHRGILESSSEEGHYALLTVFLIPTSSTPLETSPFEL